MYLAAEHTGSLLAQGLCVHARVKRRWKTPVRSRQDLADLGLCSSDLLLLQMLACFNGQEKSYFVLDLEAEKKMVWNSV